MYEKTIILFGSFGSNMWIFPIIPSLLKFTIRIIKDIFIQMIKYSLSAKWSCAYRGFKTINNIQ